MRERCKARRASRTGGTFCVCSTAAKGTRCPKKPAHQEGGGANQLALQSVPRLLHRGELSLSVSALPLPRGLGAPGNQRTRKGAELMRKHYKARGASRIAGNFLCLLYHCQGDLVYQETNAPGRGGANARAL
ncbi:hypothetical protein NDU88_002064 [Pleurodeles waltl]|uniref:Uncharacterized protein n=1 Tax=Pleurodeles waltl TaxID=8319 RepID=A0AAV7SBL9_PLEWA|nr:hypothetical protein NDU88_002064 [Pleurodeles waltl]